MATTFVPYQIDFAVKNTSKTFGFSKKRVSFKFGIASPEAIQQGATGAACRGSEHEVIFIWSLNSGKRQILCDGKDVHYSETGQNGWTTDQVFHHSFSLRAPSLPGTPLKCHIITQPRDAASGNQRPFDLRLQGASYFLFNKIFQLGTPQMVERPINYRQSRGGGRSRGGGNYGRSQEYPGADEDPYMSYEERQAIEAAKLASLKEYQEQQVAGPPRITNGSNTAESSARRSFANDSTALTNGEHLKQPPPSREEESLISFDFDPAPLPASQPYQQQQQPNTNFMSSVTLDPAIGGSGGSVTGGPPAGGNPWNGGQQLPRPPQQPAYSNYALPASYSQPPALPATNSNAFGANSAYGQPQQPSVSSNDSYGGFAQRPSVSSNDSYGGYSQPPPQNQQQAGYGAGASNPFDSASSESSNALTTYQPPAGQPQPYYQGFSQQQPPQQNNYARPPGNSYGYGQPPAPSSQQNFGQQNLYGGYGGGAAQNVTSPSNQTTYSYGSAPSFAQPPQQQSAPQYGGYPPQQQQYQQYGQQQQQPMQQQQGGFPF